MNKSWITPYVIVFRDYKVYCSWYSALIISMIIIYCMFSYFSTWSTQDLLSTKNTQMKIKENILQYSTVHRMANLSIEFFQHAYKIIYMSNMMNRSYLYIEWKPFKIFRVSMVASGIVTNTFENDFRVQNKLKLI